MHSTEIARLKAAHRRAAVTTWVAFAALCIALNVALLGAHRDQTVLMVSATAVEFVVAALTFISLVHTVRLGDRIEDEETGA